MAITYPRMLPCGVETVEFEPSYVQAINRAASGSMQALERADPRWRASMTTVALDRAGYQRWRSWLDTARGALQRVLLHDALQPYPLGYSRAQLEALVRAGGGAFDGSATVTALDAATLSLGTLPPGFRLATGDYVGLVQAGKHGLVRVAEDATASAGGLMALTVYPTGQTKHFTTAASARLVRPAVLMTIDPASVSPSRSVRVRAPVSFSAVQSLG